jgi:peptide deformylase
VPVRPLLLYPDRRLRLKAQPVTEWNDSVQALAADVIDTMRAVGAVGLTASHIGNLRRLVVIELEPADLPRTFVDPEVVWASPEQAVHTEGSVSMPGVTEEIERPAVVRVRYQDLSGAICDEEAEGFRAACLQHETDQLDGVFWTDRLSRLKRDRLVKRFEKLRRANAI